MRRKHSNLRLVHYPLRRLQLSDRFVRSIAKIFVWYLCPLRFMAQILPNFNSKSKLQTTASSTLLPVGNLSNHVQNRSVVIILTRFFEHMLDLLLSDILVDSSCRSRSVSQDLLDGFQMLTLIMK